MIKKIIWPFCICLAACTSIPTNPPREVAHEHNMSAAQTDETPDCDHAGWVDKVTPQQQKVINATFANRTHRLQHALWHSVRGGLDTKEKQMVLTAFGQSWSKAHNLCPTPVSDYGKSSYNPVGEDFLFMHRQMLHMLQRELIGSKLKCIRGFNNAAEILKWSKPNDSTEGPKSEAANKWFENWDNFFQNKDWLKTITLSQLGWSLEFSIHNNLHMRFASENPPKGFGEGANLPLNNVYPANWVFDDPKYNWLADPYGAAVNPTFWKIHGYVDHIIDLWLQANNFKSIAIDCKGARDCYEWQGTWVGEITSSGGPVGAPRGGFDGSDDSTRNFNRTRLQKQKLGVLTDDDFALRSGGSRSRGDAAPMNPVDEVSKRICKGN